MPVFITRVIKRQTTLETGMWFFSSVDFNVSVKIASGGKCFAAIRTNKRLLTGVTTHVFLQVRRNYRSFATYMTHELRYLIVNTMFIYLVVL